MKSQLLINIITIILAIIMVITSYKLDKLYERNDFYNKSENGLKEKNKDKSSVLFFYSCNYSWDYLYSI